MNQKVNILSPTGVKILEHTLSENDVRKFTLMTEDYIQLSFHSQQALAFPVGCSVGDFITTEEQVGTWNAATGVWDYQIKFDNYYWSWKNKILRYIIRDVDSAKETSFTLTATIDIHAAIIKNCLDFLGLEYGGSPFRVDKTTSLSLEAKLVRYENLSVLGGIQAIAEAFECEWWVKDNAIYFGKCENKKENPLVFEAGVNVLSISFSQAKTTAPNRIYVYGSSRNLPSNYRKVDGNDTIGGVVVKRLMLPEGTPYLQTSENIPEAQIVEQVVVLDDVYPKTDLTISEEPETYTSKAENSEGENVSQIFYRIKYGNDFPFLSSYILPNEELHIIFQSGLLNGMDFGIKFNPKGLNEKNTDGSINSDAQMFEIVANEDYGRILPDDILKPKQGDKFIITGWDSTKMADLGLIATAEQQLLEEGQKALVEYAKDLSSCTCPMAWDFMKNLLSNEDQPIPGDEVMIIDTVHFGTGGRKSRILGYEYRLDIPYANWTYNCGENISVSRLKSIENKIEGLTKTGTKVQMQNSLDFLSKRYSDRTAYLLTSDEGFQVGDFFAAVSGAMLGKEKETGQTYLEVDKIYARVRAYFEELTVVEANTLAGKQYITPGGSVKCSFVREVRNEDGVLVGWRCYFISDQDGEKTETKINVGDQAISEMFNAKEGVANKVSNHRWWRLVTAVSQDGHEESGNRYGYIEVSAFDCEEGSDVPVAGDVIAQFGNRTDHDRQAAMIFSTVDSDAPSIKLLSGIDSYSIAGKDVISYGYDPVKGNAYFNCYGDMYVGDPDGSTFIRYNRASRSMDARLRLSIASTIDDKLIADYVKDEADKANAALKDKVNELQNQIDGVIETWNEDTDPTKTNYPASDWNTDEERMKHAGDVYFNIGAYDPVNNPNAGHAWRWYYKSPTDYGWIEIADSDAVRALELAHMSVMDTDVLFIQTDSQTNTPTLPTVNASGVITDPKGWTTDAPQWVDGKYIWQTTYVRKGDGKSSFSDPTCIDRKSVV